MKNIEEIINNLIERMEKLERKIDALSEPTIKPETSDVDKKLIRDKTKYMFHGVIYSKNKLVLAVVADYIATNPETNYQKLSAVFDKSLQGSLGVVRLFSEVKDKADASKRFFTDHILSLHSGEKVVVCTQWGAFNIDRFILRAASLGFNITKLN